MKESIKRQAGRHYQQKRSNEERILGIEDKSKVMFPINFSREKSKSIWLQNPSIKLLFIRK